MEDQEELKEYMLKEIDIIQDIIKRMASNSFMLKGWTITLVVIVLLLKGTRNQILIAFIPLLVFWFLDAYFLWQERMYRKLYEWVIDYRLKTDEYLFEELPPESITIKVGMTTTKAKYNVESFNKVRALLEKFSKL